MFLPIMLGVWLVLTILFFIDVALLLTEGASYTVALTEAAASAFILTLVISLLLLIGFACGRR